MGLVKTIHSDVLRNQLNPNDSREKRHAFLTGIHSAAATIGRYKDRDEQLDGALEEINAVITDIDSGKVQQADWEATLSRAKSAVLKANDALGIAPFKPPVIEDLTVEEVLALPITLDVPYELSSLLLEELTSGEQTAFAEGLLKSLKEAGYVRIVAP